jgi:hypothetical protein
MNFFSRNVISEGYKAAVDSSQIWCETCKRKLLPGDKFSTKTDNSEKLHYECDACIERRKQYYQNLAYQSRKAELDLWWAAEMAKTRPPHPRYYYEHNPFMTPCTCDFCKTHVL